MLNSADSESNKLQWKLPSLEKGGLKKIQSQVADQALKMAATSVTSTHEAAGKLTESALRSSIDQTMSAFQIAVEQIHARKIPAEKAALTGTINVGVIQLSIKVDIPMSEEEIGQVALEELDEQ